MKRLILLSLLLPACAFGWSYSGGIYTTDGTQADANSAVVDAASNHPTATVAVPPGTFTWGAANLHTNIGSAIKLVGNGGIVNNAAVRGASGTPTIINISAAMTSHFGTGMVNLTAPATVAGIKFVSLSTACGTPISISGNSADGFRISNITYDPTNGGTVKAPFAFVDAEQSYGVIDHCSITNSNGDGSVEMIYGRGHTDAWQIPAYYGNSGLVAGIPQAVYVENCVMSGGGKSFVEFDSNGRFVVRFCTIGDGSNIDGHGFTTNGAPTRGYRMMEFYDDDWPATGGYYDAWLVRGGTFMSFDNTSEMGGSGQSWMGWMDIGTQDDFQPNYKIAITSVTGSTTLTVTTTTPHKLTVGKTIPNIQIQYAAKSLTGVYTVTTTGASTFTVTAGTGAGGGNGSLADGNILYTQTPVNYPLQDQVGRGPDISGPFTGTAGGNPGYSVNNTILGVRWARNLYNQSTRAIAIYNAETGNAYFTDNDIAEENRDVFTDLSVTSGFNGTAAHGGGVGRGTKATMNAITPTMTGVGFWVTNESSWNSTVSAGTSGQLYTWNGSAWVLAYTPFQYPYTAGAPAVTSITTVNLTTTTLHLP